MDRMMNVYAISRGSNLRHLAAQSNFDAPYTVIREAFLSEGFRYGINVPAYRLTNGDEAVLIGNGLFLYNHGGMIANVSTEEGLFYITPHHFESRYHIFSLTEMEVYEMFRIPSTWEATRIENPVFYGDALDISGNINGVPWNLWKA